MPQEGRLDNSFCFSLNTFYNIYRESVLVYVSIAFIDKEEVKTHNCLYRYTANKSMDDCAFCNADGDFLFVPQKGST